MAARKKESDTVQKNLNLPQQAAFAQYGRDKAKQNNIKVAMGISAGVGTANNPVMSKGHGSNYKLAMPGNAKKRLSLPPTTPPPTSDVTLATPTPPPPQPPPPPPLLI